MEKFDDLFGDLSEYKILTFEEITQGFEGNKNPLQNISINSFEDRSNEYSLKSPFRENSLFYKKLINKIIYTFDSVPLWRYRVENSTKGTELISNYTRYDETIDSSKGKYDEETDFIIYIEEQNSVNGYIIDINTVCLIKMSQAMINEYNETIKRNADSTILEDWSNIIIQEQKEKNNITFTKEKLLEAFKLEIAYRPLKKFSVGDKKYTSGELTDAFLDGISSAFRTLKFEEESWDYSLKSENYLFKNPEKAIVFIQNRISTSVGLLQKLEGYFYALEHIFSFDKMLLKTLRILTSLQKNNLLLIKSLLEVTKEFSRNYFAFICGIWDGIIEFITGFIDIILLMFKFYFHAEELNEEDEITYLKLKETIEEFTENYIKDPDFISKAIGEGIVNYAEVRYSENQNGYKISHSMGEDLIIVMDIIFSIVEVVKSFADAGKILPKLERWIDNALERNPTLERKLEDIRKPKEPLEEPIREKQIEEVVVEPKKKLTGLQKKRLKNIEIEYNRRRLAMNKRRLKQNWKTFFEVSELSNHRLQFLANLRKGALEYSNIATLKVKVVLKNGEEHFFEYLAHSGPGNKIKNSTPAPAQSGNKKMFWDVEENRFRWFDSENKMLVQMDEDLVRLDMNGAKVEITLESTYEPCIICKRELDLRRNWYKAKVKVQHPYILDKSNKIKGVKGHDQLEMILKNVKK
ncbi:hypothetical protein [Chryseobacterium sp. YIM B08800]|uniref:hypothetical protein n=1 Tax=Chryseobacterium sp. YIM B08800 TaxID=2984136 RepID=UPI00223F5D20|nr:hypothetical protein [Chryseobacterium sp. YIM B08800]